MIEPITKTTKTIESPVGRLSLTAADGALVRIAWNDHEAADLAAQPGGSPLPARAAEQPGASFARGPRGRPRPSA